MVNRQSRSPGELRRYQGMGMISADVPSLAIDQGGPWRALQEVGGQLANRLMQLANQAAAREGETAGMLAGQKSGASYLEARAVEERAAARAATGLPAQDGLLAAGNIDLHNRPVVKNADGTISTVRSISIGTDEGEVLIPTVSAEGKILSNDQAIALYNKTGQHLGIFKSPAYATNYAKSLHEQQASEYGGKSLPVVTGQQAGRKFSPDMSGVQPALMDKFRKLQDSFGESVTVVSGFRGAARNAAAGGAKSSQHLHGNALDLDVSSWSTEKRTQFIRQASSQGFTGIGVYNNSIHLDLGGKRAWGPSHHADSVPAWAQGAIAEHMSGKAVPDEGNGPSYSTAPKYSIAAIPTEPLALRRDGTIRGEAYDQAAISAYGWRMQQGLSTDLANAHDEFKDDPAAFQKRIGEIHATYTQDEALNDPKVREAFDKAFANGSEAYVRDVADRRGKALAAEQQLAMSEGLAAQGNALEKQAYLMGANPEGDRILGEQLDRAMTSIDHAVANGTMEPAAAAKARGALQDGMVRGRIQGTFDALDSPAKKEAYALSLLDDWAKGEGPLATQDYATVSALSQTLRRDAQQLGKEQSAKNIFEKQRVSSLIADDVASVAATGKGLDLKDSGLDPALVVAAVGEAKALEWQDKRQLAGQTWEATAGMETQTDADIAARLAMLEPKAGVPGFDRQQTIFEAAQKQATAVLKQRADDPAKAVESAFPQVAELAAAADPANPDSMQALVSARMQGQAALGISEFAREPLTKAEAMNLSRAITTESDPKAQGLAMQSLVDQVNTAYGPHAKDVLAQVLNQTGIDKDMAQAGARLLTRMNAGGGAGKTDQRAGGVAAETGAADKAAQPKGQTDFPMPNYKQQQMLLDNPDMAAKFDEKFGPGASSRILGQRKPVSNTQQVPQGTVTIAPDGSESFKPNGQ